MDIPWMLAVADASGDDEDDSGEAVADASGDEDDSDEPAGQATNLLQRKLLLARARERKQQKRRETIEGAQYESVEATMEAIRTHSTLRLKGLARTRIKHFCGKRGRVGRRRLFNNTGAAKVIVGYHDKTARQRDKGKKRHRLRPVSAGLAVQVAFDKSICTSELARSYDVSRSIVSRIECATANCLLEDSLTILCCIFRFLGGGAKMDYLFSTVMWDETKHVLSLQVAQSLSHAQSINAWQVMVCRRVLTLGRGSRTLRLEFVCPPVPMASTTAGALLDALYHKTWSARFVNFVRELSKHADVVAHVRGNDAAAPNRRLLAHEVGTIIPDNEGHAYWNCSLHQNHIIVGTMIWMMGVATVSRMYSTSLLLRTGGYFLRLILAIGERIKKMAVPCNPRYDDDDDDDDDADDQ